MDTDDRFLYDVIETDGGDYTKIIGEYLTDSDVDFALKHRQRWRFNGGKEPKGNIIIKKYRLELIDEDYSFDSIWL